MFVIQKIIKLSLAITMNCASPPFAYFSLSIEELCSTDVVIKVKGDNPQSKIFQQDAVYMNICM